MIKVSRAKLTLLTRRLSTSGISDEGFSIVWLRTTRDELGVAEGVAESLPADFSLRIVLCKNDCLSSVGDKGGKDLSGVLSAGVTGDLGCDVGSTEAG